MLPSTPWRHPLPSLFRQSPPIAPHKGAFGAVRQHHTHEGVDLYVAEGTPVRAVETGRVVAIEAFTGPAADSPWWLDTEALLVEGQSGVVVYGEIDVMEGLAVGHFLEAGQVVGHVLRVLRHDKGVPTSMLHLELHSPGTRSTVAWPVGAPCPPTLRDPTEFLRQSLLHR